MGFTAKSSIGVHVASKKPTNNLPTRVNKEAPSRRIEMQFARALKRIARASGGIVEAHVSGDRLINPKGMEKALKAYSDALTPWAKKQANILIGETIKRLKSDKAYQEHSQRMGKEISRQVFESEVGLMTMALQDEMVGLIQSLPIEAGQRAQKLALEGITGGRRAEDIARELQDTTNVTESRARLIARTETARANTALNLTRATSVGSTQYTWRTSGDSDVRDSHRKMNGKVFDWDDPPTLEDGTTGHPGTFPNCRCYAEAILPEL